MTTSLPGPIRARGILVIGNISDNNVNGVSENAALLIIITMVMMMMIRHCCFVTLPHLPLPYQHPPVVLLMQDRLMTLPPYSLPSDITEVLKGAVDLLPFTVMTFLTVTKKSTLRSMRHYEH